jgi:hypothetical protein
MDLIWAANKSVRLHFVFSYYLFLVSVLGIVTFGKVNIFKIFRQVKVELVMRKDLLQRRAN